MRPPSGGGTEGTPPTTPKAPSGAEAFEARWQRNAPFGTPPTLAPPRGNATFGERRRLAAEPQGILREAAQLAPAHPGKPPLRWWTYGQRPPGSRPSGRQPMGTPLSGGEPSGKTAFGWTRHGPRSLANLPSGGGPSGHPPFRRCSLGGGTGAGRSSEPNAPPGRALLSPPRRAEHESRPYGACSGQARRKAKLTCQGSTHRRLRSTEHLEQNRLSTTLSLGRRADANSSEIVEARVERRQPAARRSELLKGRSRCCLSPTPPNRRDQRGVKTAE